MRTVEEALAMVVRECRVLPAAPRLLRYAVDCPIADDVVAETDQPPFDRSLVDGFALRASDLLGSSTRLHIGETILAGQTPTRSLAPLEAAAIMTGAPLPPGADAVVMHERTRTEEGTLSIEETTIRTGLNILAKGRVWRAGDVILERGQELTPAALGLLASEGRGRINVIPRPDVAIVSTGDELVEIDHVPGPGQIRNSNSVMLDTLATGQGAVTRVFSIVPDETLALEETLGKGLGSDVLLITGGVSAGKRDLVPMVLDKLNVRRVFHKIRLKPGKPLWFGVGPERAGSPGCLVFGLPGNPVSGLVGFLLFVRPALRALAGRPAASAALPVAKLSRSFTHRGDRATYFPARLIDPGHASSGAETTIDLLEWSGSADLLAVARADGFAAFPPGDRVFEAGEIVGFLPLR